MRFESVLREEEAILRSVAEALGFRSWDLVGCTEEYLISGHTCHSGKQG